MAKHYRLRCMSYAQANVGIDIRDVLSAVDWYKEHGKRYHGKY